jgi:hypothetical protein
MRSSTGVIARILDAVDGEGYSKPHMNPLRIGTVSRLFAALFSLILCSGALIAAESARPKPVLLYSRHFNAQGENRYLPDGTYKDVLHRLGPTFEVRVHHEPLNAETLRNVQVVLIANPSDKAVGANPAPRHFAAPDIRVLTQFVENGGGFIIMGNQENHNLEIEDTNKLLGHFGIQFTNLYTDAKKLVLPKQAPLIGGLRWAYYTGNLLVLDQHHPAKPRGVVRNDLAQKPPKGARDQAGVLLAIAEPGRGRVAVVTDAGWITDSALDGRGIGDVAIQEQDNWEIFRRIALWTAHLP